MKLPVDHKNLNDGDGSINVYRYVDFSQALELLKDNFTVVREIWNDDLKYIYLDKDGVFRQNGGNDFKLTSDDILAEDWYLTSIFDTWEYDDYYYYELEDMGFRIIDNWPSLRRTRKEISEMENKYFDLAWYYTDARLAMIYKERGKNYEDDMTDDIRKGRNQSKKELRKKYKIKEEPYTYDENFLWDSNSDAENHAYMAALRWALGNEEWMLDT